MRKCSVGGQAVLEGVMMRSPEGIAMAVRRSDGKIVASFDKFTTKAKKGTFLGLPIVRGCVAFVESLTTGIRTTNQSAAMYGEGFEDEEPSKFEKWLAKVFGKKVEDIVIGIALILGLALSVGLFIFLPQLISTLIFGKDKTAYAVWRPIVEGVLRVGIYIGYLFFCSAIKQTRRLFMYHGAEHKTIACYEAEKEELTPENAKKYSRLHPRCGTNYLFLVMAISIFVLTCIDVIIQFGFKLKIDNNVLAFLFRFGIRLLCLPLIAGISYEILQAAAKHDNWLTKIIRAPGMGLQRITTKEPTLDMLEVAIASFHIAMGDHDCSYYNNMPDPVKEKPAEPETKPETAAEAEPETETETAAETEPEAESKTETETEAEAETEAAAEKPEPENAEAAGSEGTAE